MNDGNQATGSPQEKGRALSKLKEKAPDVKQLKVRAKKAAGTAGGNRLALSLLSASLGLAIGILTARRLSGAKKAAVSKVSEKPPGGKEEAATAQAGEEALSVEDQARIAQAAEDLRAIPGGREESVATQPGEEPVRARDEVMIPKIPQGRSQQIKQRKDRD